MGIIYTNIASIATTTLITKSDTGKQNGAISKITIANHDNTDLVIAKLYLCSTCDGSDNYVITETTIPPLATLVLDDNLSFNSSVYNLRITTNSAADITVIIK